MEQYKDHLRRLAVHDVSHLDALAIDGVSFPCGIIDSKTEALVRFAATIAVDAAPSTCQHAVTLALSAGATPDEIVACLEAMTPVLGAPRIVGAVAKVGLALGYDVDEALEWPDT